MGKLARELGLTPGDRVLALVGSGGKTTLLYRLAREFAREGESVALTTTTHIRRPDEPDFLWAQTPGSPLPKGRVTAAGEPGAGGKLAAPGRELLDALCARADRVLVEADGSRMLPIKYPNATEPVLPPQTDRVLLVAGLSALGRPLGEVCHRIELAGRALGLTPDQPADPETVARLLLAGYARYRPIVLLNQADTPWARGQGLQIARLLREGGISRVCVLALREF